MSLKTEEDAINAIKEIELSIKEMEGNTNLVFENICQTYGDISDLDSFIEFYNIYFSDFGIFEVKDFEAQAKDLWTKIDINNDNKLDENERETLVKIICSQSIDKIKKHFNII